MKFEQININQIKPAEYNPRVMPPNEMKKLKNNLKTYGLIDPILIDLTDNNTVIGGHQRLEALKEINPDINLKLLRLGDLGLVFNETNIKIKDKNDQKSMNLSLNKISGEWDFSKVDDILADLNKEHYDITLTGFETSDLILDEPIQVLNQSDDFFSEYVPENSNQNLSRNSDDYEYEQQSEVIPEKSVDMQNKEDNVYRVPVYSTNNQEKLITWLDDLTGGNPMLEGEKLIEFLENHPMPQLIRGKSPYFISFKSKEQYNKFNELLEVNKHHELISHNPLIGILLYNHIWGV